MRLIILLVASLFLASCDPSPQRGKDGYYFEKESFTRTTFPIEIVLVETEFEMKRLVEARMADTVLIGEATAKQVAAFSIIRLNEDRCTIYMLDPKTSYQPEWIGHELVHCIYGVWHAEPQKGR